MFWLRRPPYLRWMVAATVLCLGLMLDLRPEPVVAYPFASDFIGAGQPIESITWRDIPADLLPAWEHPITGMAATDIPPATPIVPALAVHASFVPSGWWVISLPLPSDVSPGTPVRIAVAEMSAEGIVAGEAIDGGFEVSAPVAFPPQLADLVATMVADSALVVMTGS